MPLTKQQRVFWQYLKSNKVTHHQSVTIVMFRKNLTQLKKIYYQTIFLLLFNRHIIFKSKEICINDDCSRQIPNMKDLNKISSDHGTGYTRQEHTGNIAILKLHTVANP